LVSAFYTLLYAVFTLTEWSYRVNTRAIPPLSVPTSILFWWATGVYLLPDISALDAVRNANEANSISDRKSASARM